VCSKKEPDETRGSLHLVVEDLGLAGLGLRDEALVQDVEDILADLLELELNLVTVVPDGGDVLIRALGLLLLLNGGDDAPRGTSCTDDVLVGDREKVALIHSQLTVQVGDLLHVGDHLIVTLGLLAKAGEESLATEELESWLTQFSVCFQSWVGSQTFRARIGDHVSICVRKRE
jgi:hypothetical protein